MTSPERTHAVVVGIERYEAGDKWDLNGAVASALRVIRWLRECDVPPGNITGLLSPLEANRSAMDQTLAGLGFTEGPQAATTDVIRNVITEQLPAKDGELLVLFWSGHGALDRLTERRLFCANTAVNAKYNIKVNALLAALSGKNFKGLSEQVVIIDACANFIQELRLSRREPESDFGDADIRQVRRTVLLAAAQGEKAAFEQKARSGLFARVVTDWLEQHASTLPPPMDQLAATVTSRFEHLREEGVTAQHPVQIWQFLHGSENERVYGGAPVPENVWRAARSTGLTTDQLRTTAAVLASAPQLATEHGRDALATTLEGAIGAVARTDDPYADQLDLVSAVLEHNASDALVVALRDLATNEEERAAVAAVLHRLELQAAIAPLLGSLRRIPWTDVLGALAETVCDVPAGIAEVDKVLELLGDLHKRAPAAPPLAEFIVRLQRREPHLQVPARWFADKGLDDDDVAALRTSVAEEPRTRRKLVIDLRESAPGERQPTVSGHLGPRWCTRTEDCQVRDGGVRGAVVKIVEWARAQAADLAIGFLLRYDMLRELPEQWEYEDMVIAPTRLCEEYPVVLHIAERIAIPALQPAWDNKLAAIEAAAGGPPSVLWLDRDDAAAIRRGVKNSNDAYVAFTFVPEARPDPRTSAVMAAIAAGAPYLVWVQAAPADGYDLRGHLGRRFGPIRDFPATLWQLRAEDPYMSGALRVIWDGQDELPPYEQLGKELEPRG